MAIGLIFGQAIPHTTQQRFSRFVKKEKDGFTRVKVGNGDTCFCTRHPSHNPKEIAQLC
jgi:hypothetical protein